jgi:hypothetical protein
VNVEVVQVNFESNGKGIDKHSGSSSRNVADERRGRAALQCGIGNGRTSSCGIRRDKFRNIPFQRAFWGGGGLGMERPMNGLIYLVGLIVVIMFILSLLGLR